MNTKIKLPSRVVNLCNTYRGQNGQKVLDKISEHLDCVSENKGKTAQPVIVIDHGKTGEINNDK